MRKLVLHLKSVFLLFIGIILLAAAPSLLAGDNGIKFSLLRYAQSVLEIFSSLVTPSTLTVYTHTQTWAFPRMRVNRSIVFLNEVTERPLFPEIWGIVGYTLALLLASFFIAFTIAVFLGWVTELFPPVFKKALLAISDLLEALPDLFFVFLIQLTVVWVYKKTGWLAANPFTSSREPSFLLPLITLSVVPAIYLFRMQLLLSDTQLEKDYITFARSKGIRKSNIIVHHLIKNTVSELSIHLPFIMLILFSQMVVLEYLFNMNGIMKILLGEQPSETRAMLLLLIALPLFGTVKLLQFVLKERVSHAR
jgi:peptide/nickel transport system permease protein